MAHSVIPERILREVLLDGVNDASPIQTIRPVGGGDIGIAARVETGHAIYFAKWQPRGHADEPVLSSVQPEADDLNLLRRADSRLVIPRIFGTAQSEEGGLLLLEWLEIGQTNRTSATALGEGLARQHRHLAHAYGLERDNLIGLTPQTNGWYESWPTFFGEQRLGTLARRLAEARRWPPHRARALDRLLFRLDELLPPAPPPSLLHGDLWGGNWLPLSDGRAALIDPAVYYGDREVDLAMTRLFGGFPDAFYDSYESAWSLEPGAPERVLLYNLYHLLNHLLLFGERYGPGVDQVLAHFA